MSRLDPQPLFVLGLLVGAIHLVCAAAVGLSALQPKGGPGWPRMRLGLRGHAAAGLGLAVLAGVVAWRVSPGRVKPPESWAMLGGLLLAAAGQAAMIRAMWAGGSTSPPAWHESAAPRAYIGLSPLAVFVLLGVLFALRGVH